MREGFKGFDGSSCIAVELAELFVTSKMSVQFVLGLSRALLSSEQSLIWKDFFLICPSDLQEQLSILFLDVDIFCFCCCLHSCSYI